MSYTKLPATTSANIFEQEYKALLEEYEAELKEYNRVEQEEKRRQERLIAWLASRPVDMFPDLEKLKQKLQECMVHLKRWNHYKPQAPGPFKVFDRVSDSLIKPLEEAWREKKYSKPLWRLITLVRNMCKDAHLARKSWVQEAIDLATQHGFTELAEILPTLRQQRDQFYANHPFTRALSLISA